MLAGLAGKSRNGTRHQAFDAFQFVSLRTHNYEDDVDKPRPTLHTTATAAHHRDAGITNLLTVLDREATEDDEESGK